MDIMLENQAHAPVSDGPLSHEGTVAADAVSYETLFGDAGRTASAHRDRRDPHYLQRLGEAMRIMDRVYKFGEVRKFQEAMQTADFPLLFGDILDRQLLGRYQEYLPNWRRIARVSYLRDFRTVKRFAQDGMEGALNSVGEQKVYPQAVRSESSYSLSLSKYGRTAGYSWEAMMNDDLDALKDTPDRFARAARRTEARAISNLYVGTTGPSGTLYTSGNANIINTTNGASATNPPLSISGIQDGFTVLGNMKDSDNEPIMFEKVFLVVPPSLEIVANNIVNATQMWVGGFGQTGGGGSAGQGLQVNNWMRNRLEVIVDPYIPILASSSNGNTSWFLFGSADSSRPALEIGFLRGYETPQLFMKSPSQTRIGGAPNVMDGDFDFDTIWYKVRHCLGVAAVSSSGTAGTGGAKGTVASNGSGS